jgi:pimeloyl-ACP methyl ester carboxylesterase
MSVDGYIGAQEGLNGWPGTVDRLASIVTPTLVVYGDLDFVLLIQAAKEMARKIPGVVLEAIPECGHSPQYERPELFNAALRRHLEHAVEGAAAK